MMFAYLVNATNQMFKNTTESPDRKTSLIKDKLINWLTYMPSLYVINLVTGTY